MSTDYRFTDRRSMTEADVRALAAAIGAEIYTKPGETGAVAIKLDNTYLWAYPGAGPIEFTRYGLNWVGAIIDAIEEHTSGTLISEHDEGYWSDDEDTEDGGDDQ